MGDPDPRGSIQWLLAKQIVLCKRSDLSCKALQRLANLTKYLPLIRQIDSVVDGECRYLQIHLAILALQWILLELEYVLFVHPGASHMFALWEQRLQNP